eukprot:358860-Chlamydomonas_euryale.AAC.3
MSTPARRHPQAERGEDVCQLLPPGERAHHGPRGPVPGEAREVWHRGLSSEVGLPAVWAARHRWALGFLVYGPPGTGGRWACDQWHSGAQVEWRPPGYKLSGAPRGTS